MTEGRQGAGLDSGASWPQRIYRRVYWWQQDRKVIKDLSGIRTVVAFGESLGDNLLCTVVAAKLHEAGRGPVAMLTPYPDLFANLPFPLQLRSFSPSIISSLRRGGPELVIPSYGRYDPALDRHIPPPQRHLIAEMCRSSGLRGDVALKPIFRLTGEESHDGTEAVGHILMQSSNRGALIFAANKEWPATRWQAVATELASRYPVAQIGAAADPPLAGVTDWRGRFSRRAVAARLANARLFVGPEGFLMHLARAVDCRSAIVLGGRSAPEHTCYPENTNLGSDLLCSPCWRSATCDYGRACLAQIRPEDVVAAAEAQLKLPPLVGNGERLALD